MANTAQKPSTVDEYLAAFPPEVQAILQQIRLTVQKAAPEATETISYQMPTYKLYGNLVHFAAYKNHIGFYPTPSGIERFKEEISGYKFAKGSVQFPLDQPIPYDLIRQIVEFRVAENRSKRKPLRSRAGSAAEPLPDDSPARGKQKRQ